MIIDNKIYSWVDVQDWLIEYFSEEANVEWLQNVTFRLYWSGLNITFSKPKNENEIIQKLKNEIFLARFKDEGEEYWIVLEHDKKFSITIEEVEPNELEELKVMPSLARAPFIAHKKKEEIVRSPMKKPVFYAFHSYKGGVGRTLHAIALSLKLCEKGKVLLIDGDFEAPGITWLINDREISFADFLVLIHGSDQQEAINLTASILKNHGLENEQIFILPAFRSIKEKTPTLEVKPENIFKFSKNPFILSDIIEKLAIELGVDYIILDLRAGISELSTGWLLDPRINKVLVTTLSSQAVLGTALVCETLAKFEKQNMITNAGIPFIIISQISQNSILQIQNNWIDIFSTDELTPLRKSFIKSYFNLDEYERIESYRDLSHEDIISRMFLQPNVLFSLEYDSLKSLPGIWNEGVYFKVSHFMINSSGHFDFINDQLPSVASRADP